MDANNIELKASEIILQRGVRVKVRAPLLLRLIGKKTVGITLRVPTGGALVRMGTWYLKCGLSIEKLDQISIEEAMNFQVVYSEYIYKALASLFLGNKHLTWLFLRPYSNWLKESMTIPSALTLLQLVILHGGLEDFMNTTRLVKGITITPPNLGQKIKRS